ncbi:MAG: hypothetical protein ACC645_26565, partial [Pirellulales bacterium]
ALLLMVSWWATGRQALAIPPGSGSFEWDDQTGQSDPDKPLTVEYFRPDMVQADTPVWIIMHGVNRNAADYRDYFQAAAAAQGALVIAPQFDTTDWPGSVGYALGNIADAESGGTPIDEQDWSFSKIEPLFDYLVDTLEPAIEADSYSMFGHSAGSQFVHRFLTWKPEARVNLAVAANAGWYTTPQFNNGGYPYDFPYSLSDTPTPAPFPVEQLTGALDNRLVVLLGDQDILQGPNFRTTDAANAQGDTRFSRGQFYYSEGKAEATARNVPFGWDMMFVRGVGHSGSKMAKSAANLFRFAVEGPPPPIVDFLFDDAVGTTLDAAVDVAGGLSWSNALPGVATDGAGVLQVAFTNTGPQDAGIQLPAQQVIDGNANDFARMIVDIEPWVLLGEAYDEEIRFGFGNTSETDVTAQVWMDRVEVGPSLGKIRLRARAEGGGGSDSGWIELFDFAGIDPLRIILDLDKAGDTFEVRYQLGDETEYVFFDGTVAPDRVGSFLRLGFDGTFDDPGDSFGISRYQVLVVPEPSSVMTVLTLVLVLTLGARVVNS